MGRNMTVVSLTEQEMVRMEMIVVDGDKEDALAFVRELRLKIDAGSLKGMKSHLDG